MTSVRYRRRSDDRQQPVDAGVFALATAALAAAICVTLAEPASPSAMRCATTMPLRTDLAVTVTVTPAPATTGLPPGLTSLPDVQSPSLYAFADQITAGVADADRDDCVHLEGYYSQSDGMQLEQVDSIVHPDSSAGVTIRRLPIISHHQFANMGVGDADFRHARTTGYHAVPGGRALPLPAPLPITESQLFAVILSYYSQGPAAEHAVNPANILDAIVDTSYQQTPRPAARAATLHLLARLPDVRVDAQAQDPLLRLMVAVTISAGSSDRTAYFLPTTGQLLAFTEITRSGYTPPGTKPPHLRQALLWQPGCTSSDAHRSQTGQPTTHRLPRTQRMQAWSA